MDIANADALLAQLVRPIDAPPNPFSVSVEALAEPITIESIRAAFDAMLEQRTTMHHHVVALGSLGLTRCAECFETVYVVKRGGQMYSAAIPAPLLFRDTPPSL